MNCELCGYPIRKDNVIGVCRSNIHCKREGMTRQRLRRKQGLVGSTSTCVSCGEPLRAGNKSGYCSANADCNRQRVKLPAVNTRTHDVRTHAVIPGRNREFQARRRAMRAGVVHVPWRWDEILKRAAGLCYLCGKTFTEDDPVQADHVIPLDKGGWDWGLNVAAAHQSCNSRKHDGVNPVSLNVKAAAASMQLAAMLGYIGWKVTNAQEA